MNCAEGRLIFACSGAADVGEISDKAARVLNKEEIGKMLCTVGLGGNVEPILKATAKAVGIIAIDGCPLECTKGSLERAGFKEYLHFRVTDLNMNKGETPVTQEAIYSVVDHCKKMVK